MCRFYIVVLAVLNLAGLPVANAQVPSGRTKAPDAMLGAELSIVAPRGDFRPGNTVSFGYGLRGALQWGPRRAFDVGLSFRSVAHDSRTYNDTVDVRNMLRTLAVSTRFTAPWKYVRPYLGASAGAAYFGTERNVETCCDENGDREWTLDGISLTSIAPMASTRVGLVIDLWRMLGPQPSTLSADFGLENHYGRRATYQVGGRGEVRRTGTHYRVYSLGVSLRTR